jgi:hypothetical protein
MLAVRKYSAYGCAEGNSGQDKSGPCEERATGRESLSSSREAARASTN